MKTNEVVKILADNWDMTQKETRNLLDVIIQTFNDNLAEGHAFSIPELGTFGTHTRDRQRSYNPHYEQFMLLPPKRVVDFNASKGLKEDVNDLEVDENE